MNVFKDYYCSTCEDGGVYYRHYLFINRRDTDKRETSFRMTKENHGIWLKHNAQWDTYAPLIVEYCVNDLKCDHIYVEELYDGN